MHIKIVNIEGDYQSIIVGHNNPVRVGRKKGYGTIYWLSSLMSAFHVDSIYRSFDCGRSQKLLLLALGLIPVVRQAAQYIVFGRSGFFQNFCVDYDFVRGFPNSTLWSSSLIYLLRCTALIKFSTKNFRLRYLSVSCS